MLVSTVFNRTNYMMRSDKQCATIIPVENEWKDQASRAPGRADAGRIKRG